ncbi:MAG TPA: hypothetical protein VLW53_11800, partial [Candidatus Eisenbacteria bacterium]|nr:hypothetical protein [Candidatus Eisenbacteria bacterium]
HATGNRVANEPRARAHHLLGDGGAGEDHDHALAGAGRVAVEPGGPGGGARRLGRMPVSPG